MTWYFDSHIHLSDPQYSSDMDFILKEMECLKIKACCVSMDAENSIQTLELAKKSNLVLPFIGIHPECANDDLEKVVTMIENNHDTLSGIGEIGLDPTYTKNDEDSKRQTLVFETLLSVAEKFHKPVSIHSRKSLDDVFQIMTSYNTKHALLHWFDGSKKQLQRAMDMGFFVSFGPVMIYANDKQTLLSKSDESKILVETDGPVRFSRCFEMKSGQIGFIPSVIFCASKILGKTFDDTAILLEKNSNSYLGI
ncbi:TatD-related deoxyribonuclease [Candidatus Nitrosopumilus koreensis AR1]|uniref:TatD-related deoxyribonuclease n=1 Tax=Candidatus Nitrosopumilus koreensis AR1 TaxID=1229908 RepID=K0B8L0_9ARCH|nr:MULTISPECIES: TatD family hydrolase [Nitrosopumilus]AFS81437.1 TatD-related deoxyribonuclease [Candidatus Nitrosopumilus koreensis AR1]